MSKYFGKIVTGFVFSLFFIYCCTLLFFSCSENYNQNVDPNIPTESHLISTVIDISDGDTFSIYYKNQKWKVRVLNVDCFEVSKGTRLTEQANKAGISVDSALKLGLKAKDFAKVTLLNKKVDLLRDYREPNTDIYGRLLRITIIDGLRYDSLIKSLGLAVPEK